MTDHKAEAERAISGLHEWQQREGETDASLLSVALEAQASATLYLAEQQRIANLIAYMQIKNDYPDGGVLHVGITDAVEIMNQAAEGLGFV